MGMGGTSTPSTTGIVLMIITGSVKSANSATTCKPQLRYGTGTAPVNGAALAGTTLGNIVPINTTSSNEPGYSLAGVVSLTVGTTYWIDISIISTDNVSACTAQGNTITAMEQ